MAAFSKSQKCARHHSIVQVEQHKGHMRHSKTTYDLKISSTFLRIVKVSPKPPLDAFGSTLGSVWDSPIRHDRGIHRI